MASSSELEPGTLFARDYRIVRHLAEGGMGAVYLVEQLSTAKQRALKIMHPHLARDPKHRARFESEARISGRIESDHVVEVLAAGVDETTQMPWLVMELLRGETLDALVDRSGPLAIDKVREIAKQLRHVLEQAHAHSLVHRDLKPENVFLATPRREDVAFTVKVLDFGIAKWVQEARDAMKNSQIIGSPMWMAPEQLSPGADIHPVTDVWALGLIFFYLLTGRSYWMAANSESTSISALLVEVAVDPIVAASARAQQLGVGERIPAGFDAWFAKATTRAAKDRIADGGLAMAQLAAILSVPAPVAVAPAPVAEPAVRPRSTLDSALDALGNTADEAEMALRLARVYELRDSDRDRAIDAYQRVLAIMPQSSDALRGLAALYRRAQQWTELASVLEREVDTVPLAGPEKRERLLELARVKEQHLADVPGAAAALTRALEADPASTKPTLALAEFLVRQGATEDAARVVEDAARALGARGDVDGRFTMLVRAADLYGSSTGSSGAALSMLDAASALRPEAVEVHERRAAVYLKSDGFDPAEARRRFREVLSLDVTRASAWSTLFELQRTTGTADQAWCTADAAVAILGEAAPEPLRAFRAQHAQAASRASAGRLSDAQFLALTGPTLDASIGAALAAKLPSLQAAHCKPPAQSGLSVKELVDPATSSRALLNLALPTYRALLGAAGALDVPSMPQLYFRAAEAPGLRHAPTVPAASIGGGAFVSPWAASDITFLAAEHAAYYRPELYARALFDLDTLAGALPTYERAAIEAWRREVELVAARAGLLLARELSAARRVLEHVATVRDPMPTSEKFRELVAFALSERYGTLRVALGIALPG